MKESTKQILLLYPTAEEQSKGQKLVAELRGSGCRVDEMIILDNYDNVLDAVAVSGTAVVFKQGYHR